MGRVLGSRRPGADPAASTSKAPIAEGRWVSVQVNYDPGWRAGQDGRSIDIGQDKLGYLVLKASASPLAHIHLSYGRESGATRDGRIERDGMAWFGRGARAHAGMRETILARLKEAPLDVLILGGGINGAGIARDLALRCRLGGEALRIGLVEQRHFASGTSGRNSQLIHGGLRYLKGLEFGLVREALHERATVLDMAPHLAHPQPFLIPMYSWFSRLFYGAGLSIYDALAGSRRWDGIDR